MWWPILSKSQPKSLFWGLFQDLDNWPISFIDIYFYYVHALTILTGIVIGVVSFVSGTLTLQGTRSRGPTSTRVMRSRVMSRGDFLKYVSSAPILVSQLGLFTSRDKTYLSLSISLSMFSPLLLMKMLLCCTKLWTTTLLLLEAKSSVSFGTKAFLN